MATSRLRTRRNAAVAVIASLCSGALLAAAPPAAAGPSGPALHGMGAMRSPGATSSPALGTTALSVVATPATPVPASVDLSRYDAEGRRPGPVNSCATWAIGYGMLGWFARSQGHTGAPFAPMYAYSQVDGGVNGGSSPASVLEVLRTQGVDTAAHYALRHAPERLSTGRHVPAVVRDVPPPLPTRSPAG